MADAKKNIISVDAQNRATEIIEEILYKVVDKGTITDAFHNAKAGEKLRFIKDVLSLVLQSGGADSLEKMQRFIFKDGALFDANSEK